MTSYDPFARGAFPVGVRSEEWHDAARDRTLPVEIWYPAADDYAGQDLDPATWDVFPPVWAADGVAAPDEMCAQSAVRGATTRELDAPAPLVLLIHGWAGFRRESTFIATHLASRGYIVVSPDVIGSTWDDVDALLTSLEPVGRREDLVNHAEASAIARIGDIAFLITTAVERLPVRDGGVGVTGASFGGYSSLVAPTSDGRVAAIAAMCPANDDGMVISGGSLYNSRIRAPWKSDPATLILAGDRDSLLPLYGQLTLLKEVPATRKQVVAMARADHNHFVDDVELGQAWLGEFAERVGRIFPDGPGNWSLIAQCVQPMEALVPGAEAKLAWQGIIAAHFDAHLRDDPQAMAAVADIDALAQQVGVDVTTIGSAGD